jgi:hypothetical protein
MKKKSSPRPRHPRQKAVPDTRFSEMRGQATAAAAGYIIRPAKTKYGPRSARWRELEYTQAAIGALFSGGPPPPHVNHSSLTNAINGLLAQDPQWRASGYGRSGKVSRMTVIRALDMYRTANR